MRIIIFPLGFAPVHGYIADRDGAWHSRERVRQSLMTPDCSGVFLTILV